MISLLQMFYMNQVDNRAHPPSLFDKNTQTSNNTNIRKFVPLIKLVFLELIFLIQNFFNRISSRVKCFNQDFPD